MSRRSASLLHLGHQGYVNIADYVIIIIATKSDTPFQDQFELLLESLSQIKNYYLIGDINIDLLECNPVADRYLKLLENHGCAQGIEEPTRVTLDSESLIDHIIHNDYRRPLEFGVIKTYITDHFAIYVESNISKSKWRWAFGSNEFARICNLSLRSK